jgi:ABC-type polysaccharide/polyol phosphate export permease
VYTDAHQSQVRRLIPDLIRSRQLLFDLVWKDIRIRYRYAKIGLLWAVLEPLIMMAVLTFVFAIVFQIDFRGTNGESAGAGEAAVSILCGLIAWQFFSSAVSSATNSLIDNRSLVTKVNFPREVIPLSSIGIAFVNLAIGSALILILYSIIIGLPGLNVVFIPLVFSIQLILAIGLGLIFSCWNARFRDVGYMVNACLLFGFYATPIIYSRSFVADKLTDLGWGNALHIYYANPMAGIITAYRELLFGNALVHWGPLVWSAFFAFCALGFGVYTFRRQAPTMSDRL